MCPQSPSLDPEAGMTGLLLLLILLLLSPANLGAGLWSPSTAVARRRQVLSRGKQGRGPQRQLLVQPGSTWADILEVVMLEVGFKE